MSLTLTPDSVAASDTALHTAATPHKTEGLHTPRQILNMLPKDATPWQQDSAVRANIHIPDVDWSKRPNPMCTPTTKADVPSDFSLSKPLYHSRSLVQPDSVYRPEYATYRQGVAGDPVSYTIAGDDLITSVLLGCFILATLSISKSGNFISRQIKNFFRLQREGTTVITETSSELRFQIFLVLQTCLLCSLLFFLWRQTSFKETFILPHYQIIGIYTGIFALYFLLKMCLSAAVGWVFFDKKNNEQWTKSSLFLVSTEGILIFPAVMLLVYFNLSIESVVLYTLLVVILGKLLTFYKTYLIFFQRNRTALQNILYFCTLEIMPLGALWGILVLTDELLKTNF